MGDRYLDQAATPDERTYALLGHLSLILANLGLPIVPILIMWLIKRKDSPFIDDHGKEALNFQISILLYWIIAAPFVIIGVGLLLWGAIWVLGLVGMILASIAANRGEFYRYPATLRLVR